MNLFGVAEQGPPAGNLVKPARSLLLFDIAAATVKSDVARLSFKDQNCIGGPGKAIRPTDHVERIVSFHFPDVVNNNDGDPAGVGQFMKTSYRHVVSRISGSITLWGRADFFKGVHDDQDGLGHGVAPFRKVFESAGISLPPIDREL